MSRLPWLDPFDDEQPFPSLNCAMVEPDGLLAVGGNLSPTRLLRAYRAGIFPWYSDGQPILWWSPNPRMVLFPDRVRVSRSLRRTLSRARFRVTADADFAEVIRQCAAPRGEDAGTWISPAMIDAYQRLHRLGCAHSVEVWRDERLAGGLYGVSIGRMFYGESMFSRAPDASKVALVTLARQLDRWGFGPIDCQMHTEHLVRIGAEEIPRATFQQYLRRYCEMPAPVAPWAFDAAAVRG